MRPLRSTKNMPWLTLENNWNMERAASSRMPWASIGSAGASSLSKGMAAMVARPGPPWRYRSRAHNCYLFNSCSRLSIKGFSPI